MLAELLKMKWHVMIFLTVRRCQVKVHDENYSNYADLEGPPEGFIDLTGQALLFALNRRK